MTCTCCSHHRSYYWGATPTITSLSPPLAAANTIITITGNFFFDISQVQLQVGGVERGLCLFNSTTSSSISCTLPNVAAGAYTVVLRRSNGEWGVDPNHAGRVLLIPSITQVRQGAMR